MNYLRLAIAVLVGVCAQYSHADTIPAFQITQVSMVMDSGGGVFFSFTGPNVTFTGSGAEPCFDCANGGGPSGGVFVSEFDTAIFEGKSYDAFDTLFFNTPLFDCCGGVNPTAIGFVGDPPFQFKLILPQNGSWQFDFIPDPSSPTGFDFNGGTFSASATVTPESGTIGLVLTGLAGIAGIVKRKAKAA